MKHHKKQLKFIFLLGCFALSSKMFSQFVTTDAGAIAALEQLNVNVGEQTNVQMQGIVKYVEQIQKIKQYIHVAKEGMKQAKQTADVLTAMANGNVSLDGIKDLNLNKSFEKILEDVLCINFKDYQPNNQAFLRIHASFMSGIGKCNNLDYYSNTYSGMNLKSKSKYYDQNTTITYKNFLSGMKKVDKEQRKALENEAYTNNLNDRTKVEIGYKMLKIADEMIASAEELQKTLNISQEEMKTVQVDEYKGNSGSSNSLTSIVSDMSGLNEMMDLGAGYKSESEKNTTNKENSKGVDMSKAERLQLILKSKEYLAKGLEYKQKAVELINEGSSSEYSKNNIRYIQRKYSLAELESKLYGRDGKEGSAVSNFKKKKK